MHNADIMASKVASELFVAHLSPTLPWICKVAKSLSCDIWPKCFASNHHHLLVGQDAKQPGCCEMHDGEAQILQVVPFTSLSADQRDNDGHISRDNNVEMKLENVPLPIIKQSWRWVIVIR